MKRPSNSQSQMMLILGLMFVGVGISLMGPSRGTGIVFLVAGCIFLAMSLGAFGAKKR